MVPCRHILAYILEVTLLRLLKLCFVDFVIPFGHVTPGPLLINPLCPSLSFSTCGNSLFSVILCLKCLFTRSAILLAMIICLTQWGGSHHSQANVDPQRGFHSCRNQNPLTTTSCGYVLPAASFPQPFPSPAGVSTAPHGPLCTWPLPVELEVTFDTLQAALLVPTTAGSNSKCQESFGTV